MKRSIPTNLLAIMSISAGCYYIFRLILKPLYLSFNQEELSPLSYFFDYNPLEFTLFMLVPVFMTCYFGYMLFREVNKTNIKGSVGGLAIFGFFWIGILLGKFFFSKVDLLTNLPTTLILIAILLAVFLYTSISKFVMKKEGLIPDEKGEFIGRGILLLMSIWVMLSSSEIVREFAPKDKQHSQVLESPWEYIDGLGTILLAVIFYNIGVKLFVKKREKVTTF